MVQQPDPENLLMKVIEWDHAESVRLGEHDVPKWIEVELSHPEWSATVVLTVTVDTDRGPVVTGLRAGAGSTASYREVQHMVSATADLDTLVWDATTWAYGRIAALRFREQLPEGTLAALDPDQLGAKLREYADLVSRYATPALRPTRRRRMTRALLREVAEVYRAAITEGEAPTKAVADRYGVSHRTAGRWVAEARQRGELGPAKGPTAGELEADEEGGDGGTTTA
ncbi:MAG: hypothetical protein ACRDT2_02495 [Natronosporangium sp.]